jgi:hypothetical protein
MIIVTYENHYSANLNKCFYLQIRQHIKTSLPTAGPTFMDLWDLNGNKNYGNLMKSPDGHAIICRVQNKICHSESEWQELVKPYMEQ